MISFNGWRHWPVRRKDKDGLTESGYVWDEVRFKFYVLLALVAACGVIASTVAMLHRGFTDALVVLIPALTLLVPVVWVYRRPRTVVFRRDGAILTPHGVRGRLGVRKLRFPHWEIASIELCPQGEDFGVMLFTTEGASVLLAKDMYNGDARLVAVQLTKALREMRESMAVLASQKRAAPAKRNFVLVH